jgi:hypothetical protein
MGNSCHCSDTQIEKENSTQYEFGERENIITQIKSKFEKKYNTSEYITKEDFNKLLLSFPNCQELISDLEKNNSDHNLNLKNDELTPNTTPQSERISHQDTNIIENIDPIKFCGDDDQYSVYNFNINKEYYFTGKGYHITNDFLYYGNIDNNLSNGKGILIDRNGNSLYGDWENGQCEGKGILKIKNLLEYEGDFVKNKKNGYGIEKYLKDGSIYEGEFKDNKKNGKGKCILNNGETYEGEFLDDLYDGEGTYKWSNELREYKGHFCKGIIDGKGINKYADGSTYEGFYKKGIKHGYGIYTWPCGKICKGNWVNNKLHGNAFFEEGDKKYNIIFRFGKIISASEVDENKIIKFEVDNIINKDNLINKEKYKCFLCNKLIYNPHKCCNCDTNYCLSCIKSEGDNSKNIKCKNCGNDKYETNMDLSSELVKNIKVYCDLCQIELDYKSAINHVH